MGRLIWALAFLVGMSVGALAVNDNPQPGSVWTYHGSTLGADWDAPNNLPCPLITLYGGPGDYVSAWTLALASQVGPSYCISFPAGTFNFASQVTFNLDANGKVLTVKGAGTDVTNLLFPTGGGIRVNGSARFTAVHFSDMTILSGAVNTGTGVDLEWGSTHNDSRSMSTFENVRIAGTVVGTTYFATNVKLNGISEVNFIGFDSFGDNNGGLSTSNNIGLDMLAPSNNLSFIYYITNSNFFGSLYGIRYGSNVQGLAITNTNFTLNWNGIYIPASSSGNDQLSVMNSQFDNTGDNILVDTAAAFADLQVSYNLFYVVPATAGVHLKGLSGPNNIVGNIFNGTAVGTASSALGVNVESNAISFNYNLVADNNCKWMATCIALGTLSTQWHARDNTAFGGTRVYTNASTSNWITGFTNTSAGISDCSAVTNAVSNGGPNLVRLTVASTVAYVTGQVAIVAGVGGVPIYANSAISNLQVVDATHLDLLNSTFSGAYTSGGTVCNMP